MAVAGTLTLTASPGAGDVGQAVLYTATILDASGSPVTPATLTLTITAPDGTSSNVVIGSWTAVTTGVLQYTDLPATAGVFQARAVSTGPNAADDVTITVVTSSTLAWTPTADDVAALLAQRTIDATGLPTGHFSKTSEPSTAQVELLIALRAGEVSAACGPIPSILAADAKLVTILGTAVLVEESFEDATAALVAVYSNQYERGLTRLAAACADVNQDGQVDPVGSPPEPLFNFADLCDATTRDTRW